MKKVDIDPFSNGTEFMLWNEHNCDLCIKASRYNAKKDEYTKYRCSIQRDIDTRAYCNEPINERTVTICKEFTLYGERCPNLQTERKKRTRKIKEQLELL